MNIKKKLILMGICVGIILVIFTVNVIRRLNMGDEKDIEEIAVKENVITRAEAYRLLSFLEYDKAGREALPVGIQYSEAAMSGWYDSYVNAVWKMGLIEVDIEVTPKETLTYGDCKILIDKLIMKNPDLQAVYAGLSFDFVNSEEEMLIQEFLEVYEATLSLIPEEKSLLKEETLFVLQRELSEEGKDRIVTDLGRYYYENAKNYEILIENIRQQAAELNSLVQGETTQSGTPEGSEHIQNTDIKKNDNADRFPGTSLTGEDFSEKYINHAIKALVCDKEIVYLSRVTTEKVVIHNVWIKQGEDLLVETYINGVDKAFNAQNRLSTNIAKVVGDISIEDGRVVGISVKPDLIHGKVLLSGEDYIEVEGYGKIYLEEDYKIYKLYDELSMEQTNSILVGYETTDFVVSAGKISAALIRESIKAENIRVLLHTTNFKDIYHDSLKFTVNTDFTVTYADKEDSYKKGDTITVKPGDELFMEGRIKIAPSTEKGRIELLSVERSTGNPKYRGSIEISEGEEGLLVVNELPLEEYLYAVIPSEMPTYYGLEALKVQAVCARSYAYRHLLANSLSSFGAHVDDSVSYQVYNNIEENEDSILAVKDTYGKVAEYAGEVITAYYFSTSCGHTTDVESVWANGVATPYLSGRLMAVEDSEGVATQSLGSSIYKNLSKEENFRSFILDREFATYDSGFNWYRWNVKINAKDIKKNIDKKLAGRYNANPELIKTLTSGSEKDGDAVYESILVDTVGDIVDISAYKRDTGGIISELLIVGTKNTIKVQTEYNIRVLLSPISSTVYRLDESGVDDLSLLPSAFFVIVTDKGEEGLDSITLNGGGYGHGVGMSQNGVKSLADEGKKYDEIVTYFYKGTKLGFIYE
ncbi:MAG TPA: SpoIID/LytB domain-containing protein [Mobilitalea sp.]|nr:SpoIID/LytB domain-containing protein [Mobilitalea sp.]